MVFTTSVFLEPVSKDLHIGRGTYSTATGLANIVMAFASPLLGRLIDRFGMRIVMLPVIAMFALATAGLSLLTTSLLVIMLMYAIQGFFSCVQLPTGYSKMITARFNERRGLALGIALSGQGLGTVFLPQYMRYVMGHYGWRAGYIALGVAVMILAFIPVAVLFAEPEEMKKNREMVRIKGSEDNPALPGISLKEAWRTPKYWAAIFTVFLLLCVTNGTLTHIVAMLSDRGISTNAAVAAVSISGVAMIFGRVASGYLLDKVYAVYIFCFFIALPMIGAAILLTGAGGVWSGLAVICMGLALGAEVDLMPFIVSRYFGIRSFGALFGFVLTFVALANASGMMLMGWCYQLLHSYTPMLYAFELFLVVAILLITRMGPYRYPAPGKQKVTPPAAYANM